MKPKQWEKKKQISNLEFPNTCEAAKTLVKYDIQCNNILNFLRSQTNKWAQLCLKRETKKRKEKKVRAYIGVEILPVQEDVTVILYYTRT